VIASFYAVHHGPDGLRAIAERLIGLRLHFEAGLRKLDFTVDQADRFDTVTVTTSHARVVHAAAAEAGFNLRVLPDGVPASQATGFGVSFDEFSDQRRWRSSLKQWRRRSASPRPRRLTPQPTSQQKLRCPHSLRGYGLG